MNATQQSASLGHWRSLNGDRKFTVPDDSRASHGELQAVCEYLQSRYEADLQRIVRESEKLLDPLVAVIMDLHALSQVPLETCPLAAQRDKLNTTRALLLQVIQSLRGMVADIRIPTETDFYAEAEALAAKATGDTA